MRELEGFQGAVIGPGDDDETAWGGGHAVAGHAVSEGGVMVDLSTMTGVRVDPLKGLARASAEGTARGR